MEEQMKEIFIPYTYTYDQFTVFFYGDRIFVGEKDFPTGQCSVDMMNLSEDILNTIDHRVQDFLPAAQRLLTEKTDSAAASAQEKLNAVWDVVFTLPVYRDLKLDEVCSYHALEHLLTDEDKWMQIKTPGTEGYAMYQEFLKGLSHLAEGIRMFQNQIATMAEHYFEPLKRRNSAAYAQAYSQFYGQMVSIAAHYFHEDFEQSTPVEVSFVPMMHPTQKGGIFVAEKTTFQSLLDFLVLVLAHIELRLGLVVFQVVVFQFRLLPLHRAEGSYHFLPQAAGHFHVLIYARYIVADKIILLLELYFARALPRFSRYALACSVSVPPLC